MNKAKLSSFSIIPTVLLTSISGGNKDEDPPPSSPITIVGGGDLDGAGGVLIGSIPVGPTTIKPFISVNTTDGVTGGGISIFIPYG